MCVTHTRPHRLEPVRWWGNNLNGQSNGKLETKRANSHGERDDRPYSNYGRPPVACFNVVWSLASAVATIDATNYYATLLSTFPGRQHVPYMTLAGCYPHTNTHPICAAEETFATGKMMSARVPKGTLYGGLLFTSYYTFVPYLCATIHGRPFCCGPGMLL